MIDHPKEEFEEFEKTLPNKSTGATIRQVRVCFAQSFYTQELYLEEGLFPSLPIVVIYRQQLVNKERLLQTQTLQGVLSCPRGPSSIWRPQV